MKTQQPTNGFKSMLQGQAGVYAVVSQLCLRGIVPFFPAVDCGVDLMLENGLRIQVKSAHLTYPKVGKIVENFGARGGTIRGNYLGGAYGFNVRRGDRRPSDRKWMSHAGKGYGDIADFFVLWGIEDNRFWIVPTSIKNRVIWFGRLDHPNGSNNSGHTSEVMAKRNARYENRWDLLDVNSTVETLIEGTPETVREEKI